MNPKANKLIFSYACNSKSWNTPTTEEKLCCMNLSITQLFLIDFVVYVKRLHVWISKAKKLIFCFACNSKFWNNPTTKPYVSCMNLLITQLGLYILLSKPKWVSSHTTLYKVIVVIGLSYDTRCQLVDSWTSSHNNKYYNCCKE